MTSRSKSSISIIVLLGAARSGTTLLGEYILSHHFDLTYWGEPNHVWSYGDLYSTDEVRDKDDATDEVKEYIRGQFADYLAKHDGKTILEKTPANCMRIPFIDAIFPEARYVHVVRDGRDVALSAQTEWKGGKTVNQNDNIPASGRFVDWAKMLYREVTERNMLKSIRPHQIPHYLFRALDLMRVRFTNKPSLWGPRIPNLSEIRRSHTLLETCAIQWRECVDAVARHWENLPESRRIELRYEDLLANPHAETSRLIESLKLPDDPSVLDQLDIVKSSNTKKWSTQMSLEEQKIITELIAPSLRRYDYL